VMIHQGRKVLDEPMAGLKRQYDPRTILFEPLTLNADVTPLRALPGVERVDAAGEGYRIGLADGADPAPVMRAIAAALAPARIELARLRLEDVFIRIVTGSAAGGAAARALRAELDAPGPESALA
jgi:ABC-type uncharacterized transport system ATPase subunit